MRPPGPPAPALRLELIPRHDLAAILPLVQVLNPAMAPAMAPAVLAARLAEMATRGFACAGI